MQSAAYSGRRFVQIDPRLLEWRNLLIVAPTGTGKTTATIRAVWELVRSGKFRRAIICLPTRAACEDVARTARKICGDDNVGVDTSDARLSPDWRLDVTWSKPIIVTTYERADSVALSSPDVLDGAILVIDEAHNMLYPERATAIIDLLTLARMLQDQGRKVRIVLLSATMPMIDKLRHYLDAEVISVEERPVELVVKTIPVTKVAFGRGAYSYYRSKMEDLKRLLKELNREYAPVLIYVPSRQWAEQVAKWIQEAAQRGEIPWLRPDEVVYHHAGLPYGKRREIEEELKKQNPKYKIVVATDTLSQSVNLSFRTVIVLGLKLFLPDKVEQVQPATVMQVLGRAGRPGYQNVAYGFILYTPDEEDTVKRALGGLYGEVALIGDYLALPLRLLYSGRDIDMWMRYAPFIDREKLEQAVDTLRKMRLITISTDGKKSLTELGKVLAREYLPSQTFGYAVLLSLQPYLQQLQRDNGESTARTALAIAGALSYLLQKMWTVERQVGTKLLESGTLALPYMLNTVDVDTALGIADAEDYALYDALNYDYPKFVNVEIDKLLEPDPELPYKILHSPETAPADNVAESLRKAAQVMTTLAREGVLPSELEKYGQVLARIFKAYRRLLRTSPQLARDFATIFLNPDTVEKLTKLPLVDYDAVYTLMKTMNIRDVEKAIKTYLSTTRRPTTAHNTRRQGLQYAY